MITDSSTRLIVLNAIRSRMHDTQERMDNTLRAMASEPNSAAEISMNEIHQDLGRASRNLDELVIGLTSHGDINWVDAVGEIFRDLRSAEAEISTLVFQGR